MFPFPFNLCSPSIVFAASISVAGAACAQSPSPTPAGPPSTLNSAAQSRVVVAIQPLGKISYDGLFIPITSPDGRYIVSQSGRTPAWDVILADKTAKPPVGLTLSAFTIPIEPPAATPDRDDKQPPKPASISLIKWPRPFTPNVILGRAADNLGFLVEAPQLSGSRWIGRASWLSGEVEWLIRDGGKGVPIVNAHAALAGDGSIAYVRREVDAAAFQLVVRSRKNESSTEIVHAALDGSESYAFPFFSPDSSIVAAFAVPSSDMAGGPVSLVAFARPDPQTGASLSLVEVGRVDLGRGGVAAAFQAASTIQSPLGVPAAQSGEDAGASAARDLFRSGLLFLSMRDGTTVWWEPRRAQFVQFEAGAAVAAPFQHAEFSLLLGGDKDMLCQPLRLAKDRESLLQPGRAVSVLAGRSIPRFTTHQNGFGTVAIALTPAGTGQESAFRILLISPAKPD
ncbi:MAG: hypothetical protein IT438_09530 [Phycisphaerales bacterium]|nr:hypothetical protein [Phycisphaerales bacterium]